MNDSYFYVLALSPDLNPERVKMGIARCVSSRIRRHRTAAPTARLIGYWPCVRNCEIAAIRAATVGCKAVGGEVFDADSTGALVNRLARHFGAQPETAPSPPAFPPQPRSADDVREYREVMDALAPLGVSATDVARAAGVSLNSVSRARMDTGNRRSPPKNWKRIVRNLALERAAALSQLADASGLPM